MTNETKPLSVSELKSLRKPIRNTNIEHQAKMTPTEKMALWVTIHIGSMGFFFFILLFNAAWMLWNALAPVEVRFDTAWEFLVLLFINNILQILFMPLIMVGQNLQNRHAEHRAEMEFEVNIKAEREIENVLLHLEQQNELITKLLNQAEHKE
jgi:uncharacterized membrane protein